MYNKQANSQGNMNLLDSALSAVPSFKLVKLFSTQFEVLLTNFKIITFSWTH